MLSNDRNNQEINLGDYAILHKGTNNQIGRVFILPSAGTGANPEAYGLISHKDIFYDDYCPYWNFSGYPFIDKLVLSKTFKMQHWLCWSFGCDLTVVPQPVGLELELPYMLNNLA